MAAVSETSDGVGDRRIEAQGEVAVAVLALDSGDLTHAADHIAGALQLEPLLPEAHECLARLVVAAGGVDAALTLYPTDRPSLGAMGARAHVLAADAQWDSAVSLLTQVVAFDPSLPWARTPWLGLPDIVPALSADTILYAVLALNRALPEPVSDEVRQTIAPLYELLCAAVESHDEDARLLAMGSSLARRFTAFELAESLAVRAHRISADQMTSVMLGQVYRRTGRPDEAIEVWADQLRRDPSDEYLHVDLAELYADTGRPELGLPWLDAVVANSPAHEKAAPALLGLRYRIDGDTRHLVALADHLREYPDHHYAGELLAQFCSDASWLGYIEGAGESLVNLLRQVFEQVPAEGRAELELRCTVSMIEPPSAVLTVRRALPRVDIIVSEVGDPDPRLPLAAGNPAGIAVWHYPDGAMTAVPIVAPPSAEAAEKIRWTTQLRWPHLPAAYDFAVALSDLPLPDLLGALVHPPAPDADPFYAQHPELWVRAVQMWSCLGIAHHRVDEPWQESTRRTVLFDLLDGVEDWVCEAAAVALVAIAWMRPDARVEIGLAICRRFIALAEASQSRAVTILDSFCRLTLACPWVDPGILDLARALLEAETQE
ncbi:tetratricopeptide repeat protein [Nocardia sp. NPDC058058]|uniref:tetratricopeptide repeat protein n=1 Tax=Nocardia sp. NPDC058058 TaxID=3346317 RepID=UPI0036D8CD88